MLKNEEMLLTLHDNVYLVKGKLFGCIYDFNTLKLYHINKRLVDLIDNININEKKLKEIECFESREILNRLLEYKILKLTTLKQKKTIQEIRLLDQGIKFAWIEITTKCNLKCIHCYNNSSIKCMKKMSIDDFKDTIDSLLKINIKKIQIIGGEPFIVEELREMIDYAIGKFEFIEIFTNGTLITDKWIKYLKNNNIRVALSVYSYDAKEHDKVTTVKGSHKKTHSIIEKLYNNDIKYRVCNVIMKNIDLGKRNTNLYKLNPKKDILRISGRGDISFLSKENLKNKLITKDTFTKPLNKDLCQRMVSGHNCFRNKIYIGVDKTIYACVMERRITHGKIAKNHNIKLNEHILNFNKDFVDECRYCEFRYTCFDCRPDSIIENIYSKPWYCTYDPLKGKWENPEKFIDSIMSF